MLQKAGEFFDSAASLKKPYPEGRNKKI